MALKSANRYYSLIEMTILDDDVVIIRPSDLIV